MTKVNSLWPNPQLLIALHSPKAASETGLRMCLPEKSRDRTASDAEQSVLRSPVCQRIIAKYGHVSRISEVEEPTFSAVQTAWRRGRDSNPPYRSRTCKVRMFA
jgi:Ni/Co efflux regulator RcnB